MLTGKKAWGMCLALLGLLAGNTDLWAQEGRFTEGPVDIEADQIAYDADLDTYDALGKVLITFTGGFLKADAVQLNRITNRALAQGNVYIDSERDILEGETVDFDIVAKTGTVGNGKMFLAKNHFYIEGEKIEKTGVATYRLEDAKITACDGTTPDWSITGTELDLTVDGYGVMKHGRFQVRDLPVFYTPYMVFPAKTTRQSGLLFPRLAYSRDKNGLDIEVPFYWAINDQTDATFYQRYMSERGFKEGVEFRYYLGADSFGTFYGDFLNDRKQINETEDTPRPDWQGNHNRWSYYLNHQSTFSSGFALRSDIRKVSDRWYFKDFTSHNYYLNNYSQAGLEPFRRVSFLGDETLGSLDSTVRLTKDWSQYNLTALFRYTDDFSTDSNNATFQKYPEVTLTGFRQPLFGEFLQMDFTGNYTHWYRNEGQKGHIGEMSPNVYLPMMLGPLSVTPRAGFQGDLWERTDSLADSGEKGGHREIYRFGTALSTDLSRVYTVGSKTMDKVRHSIYPTIEYSYIPESVQDRIPNFLGQIPAQNSFTYSLTQTLTSRMKAADGKVSYQELMRFKLLQSYDVREERRSVGASDAANRPFSNVSSELDVTPFPFLTMAARNTYNVNSGLWVQSNYDLTVSNKRGDWLSTGYRYTRDSLESLNLTLKASLTPSLEVLYSLRRNLLAYKNIESLYRVVYNKQCWNIEFNVSDAENNRGFMVLFSLSGFRTEALR